MITLAMASCCLSSGWRLFLLAERFLSAVSGKTSRCLWPLVSTGSWKTESGSMTAVSRSAGRGPLRDWYRGSLAPAKFIFFRRSTEMTAGEKHTELVRVQTDARRLQLTVITNTENFFRPSSPVNSRIIMTFFL